MIETLQKRFAYQNFASTYCYLFSHRGSASFSQTENYEGTSHADDLIYLFPLHKNRYYSSVPTDDDEILIRSMPLLWMNFAKFG
jgi:carboxylesterase type B